MSNGEEEKKDVFEELPDVQQSEVPIAGYEEETEPQELTRKIKDKAKKVQTVEVPDTSYLLREIPLFKYEWLALGAASILSVVVVLVELLGLAPGVLLWSFMPPLVVMWGLYLVKMQFFMPRGKKIIVEKFYPNKGINWEVIEPPSDNIIHFDKQDKIPPTLVGSLHKHHHISLGRPCVIAVAGHGQNVSLHELVEGSEKSNLNAKDLNNTMNMVLSTGLAIGMSNSGKLKDKMQDWLPIIVVLTFIGMAALAFLLIGQGAILEEIAESLAK